MVQLVADDRAARLLHPVRGVLDRALALMPDAPPVEVGVGPVPDGAPARVSGGLVTLSDTLESGIHHPTDRARPFGVDRWRRAAACVLEAVAGRELAARTGRPVGDDWRWVGMAVHAADAVAPELSIALPDLATAIATGSPGSRPRAGVAVMRAWAAQGLDPVRQTRYLLEGGVLSAPEWAAIGAWVLGGPLQATLPGPVDRVSAAELGPDGLVVPAWTWQPFRRADDGRGAFLEVTGDGLVDEPWAAAGADLLSKVSAASTPVRVASGAGAPLGAWDVASAEGFGQVVGARGVRFEFRRNGILEVVLGDAFVGPLAALAMAEQVGTSGLCQGRWRVVGQRQLRFEGIDARSLTLHGRTRDRFLVPAKGFGLAEWLGSLGDGPWAWVEGPSDRLVLRGRMRGVDVEVRLKRVP